MINQLSLPLDPRGFQVFEGRISNGKATHLMPFWENSPEKGFISIFDRSWYRNGIEKVFNKDKAKEKYFEDALNFERHHLDSDTLVIKFFLHISQKEQSSRLKNLTSDENTSWRVNEDDFKQNFHYKKFRSAREFVIDKSNDLAEWEIIPAHCYNSARIKVMSTVIEKFREAIKSPVISSADDITLKPVKEKDPFEKVDLSLKLTTDEYKEKFSEYGEKLTEFGFKLFRSKVPMVIVYEGWDAAGKGGSIRRLTSFFDPRNYKVIPIAAPTQEELDHNYLWRFWKQIPDKGQVTIFDRSWYGRVLVERVEGYCRPDDWKRAYSEINDMEKHLTDSGVMLIKFWMEISPEEQLHRFERRLEIDHKRWKITDEDWRNRNKWDQYKSAVDEMILRTSTESAPWTIVEGNNKQYARIKTMKTVLNTMREYL